MTVPPEGQERIAHYRHFPFGQGLYWASAIGAVSPRALIIPATSASADLLVVKHRFPTAMAMTTMTGAAMMPAENRCFMLASTLMVERSSGQGEAAHGLSCIIDLLDREVCEAAHSRRRFFTVQRMGGRSHGL
jgi:hypothetical protein